MKGRYASQDDVATVDIPEPLAAELKERYRPVARRCIELMAIRNSCDLGELLLSVYLQGVVDGSNPQVQARLRAGKREAT